MEKLPNIENVESQINQLLEELNNYAINQFPEEIQNQLADDWYDAEMEAKISKDRSQALEHLRQFVDKLARIPKK